MRPALKRFVYLLIAALGVSTLGYTSGVIAQKRVAAIDYYGKQIDVFRLFGQANIADAGRNRVTSHGIYHAAGVTVDANSINNRIYVVDTGNSRILGFRLKGPNGNLTMTGKMTADMVFGQADFESSNCNGDSNLGFTKPPTASTLCLLAYPLANNTAESWMRVNIDVDAEGNLYVPDFYNNRVLKFNQPYSPDHTNGKGDAIADYVWGQDTFTTNLRNGSSNYAQPAAPSATSLWINYGTGFGFDHVTSRGMSVDPDGNVWVADTYNSRILRFRQNNKTADLVIGQTSFSTAARGCQDNAPLNRLCTPTLARIHPTTGDLYVLDEYPAPFRARMLVFHPPFTNGMTAFKTIAPNQGGPFQNWGAWDGQGTYRFQSTGFIFNKYKQGAYATGEIWLNEHSSNRALLIDLDGNIVKVIGAPTQFLQGGGQVYDGCWNNVETGNHLYWPGGSIGMDSRNNIYFADEGFNTIFRYALPYQVQNYNGYSCLPDTNGILFPKGANQQSDDRLGEAVGLAVYGSQLLILDEGRRLKVYNSYQTKAFGAAPDFVLRGGFDGRARLSGAADDQNRLWMMGENDIKIYQMPFTSNANAPLVPSVRLYWADTDAEITNFRAGSIAFDNIHHAIYITESTGTRIFRVTDYTNLNRLHVDMVIGQVDKTNVQCNRGLSSPTASTLCKVSQIKFDRLGNLFVIDNDYECQGNRRMVMFRTQDLGANTMFPDLAATKVFNSTSLTQIGQCAYWTVNSPGSPVSVAFNSRNEMVVGNDGYYGNLSQRHFKQLWLYLTPLTKQTPDAAIDLYMGTPGELDFDSADNLLIQDHTWYRGIMINLDADPEWLVPIPSGREQREQPFQQRKK